MKFTKAVAALAGVAAAANPVKESTENYMYRCVYQNKYYGASTSCGRTQIQNACCTTKEKFAWSNWNACYQAGGRYCRVRVRNCGGYNRNYRLYSRRICKKTALNWRRQAGAAWNLAYNKKFWVIGTNVEAGGYGIYRWDGHWTKIPGSAIRASVDAYGRGWVVNKYAYIYGYINNGWRMLGGRAWDIDVSTGNKLWVIGTNAEAGGYGIYRWDGHWTKIPGSAVRVAVDGNGLAWVVNKYRRIYRFWGGRWYMTNGLAFDIAAHDGNVAVVGTNRRLYRRYHLGNTWDVMNAFNMKSVALGAYSRAACTTTGAAIWAGY